MPDAHVPEPVEHALVSEDVIGGDEIVENRRLNWTAGLNDDNYRRHQTRPL